MNPQRQAIIAASIIAFGMLSACSTLSTDTALLLAKGGAETPAWQNAGIPSSQVASWIHHGFTASQAAKWCTEFPVSFAADGASEGITASRAAKWRDAGFSPSQAYRWNTGGQVSPLSPQQAALWRHNGFNAAQAGAWSDSGFSPQTAQVWEKAGVDNAKEAAAWNSRVVGQNGITQPQVLKTASSWRVLWKGPVTSGMYSAAATLMRKRSIIHTLPQFP